MENDSFEFDLQKPVGYHHGGDKREGQRLVLSAPSARHNKVRHQLQQGFVRALRSLRGQSQADAAPTAEASTENTMSSSEVMSILMMSDIDMYEYNEQFKKLLFDGVCMVEGEERLTSIIYNEFSAYDCDRLLGEYIAVFIGALALKLMTG